MPGDRKQTPSWVRYSGLGLELGAVIGGLTLLGAQADRHYGVGPWGTLTGFGLGLFGGFYRFIRSALRAMRAASSSDRDTNDDKHG